MRQILKAFAEDGRSRTKYGIKRVHAIRRIHDAMGIERSRNPFTRFFRAVKEIDGEGQRMERMPVDTTKWKKFKADFAKAGAVALAWHVLGEGAPAVWKKHGLPSLEQAHEIVDTAHEEITPAIDDALKLLSTRNQYDKYHLLSFLWSQVRSGSIR